NAGTHRVRHTLATRLLARGAAFEEIADILGNTLEIVRKHYAKWSKGRQDRIDEVMLSHVGALGDVETADDEHGYSLGTERKRGCNGLKLQPPIWCGEGDLFSFAALKRRKLYTSRTPKNAKSARNTPLSRTVSHTARGGANNQVVEPCATRLEQRSQVMFGRLLVRSSGRLMV